MRVKESDASAIECGYPKEFRVYLKPSAFHTICDSFAADWLYNIFDEPDDIDVSVNERLNESWDIVGYFVSNAMGRIDEQDELDREFEWDTDIVNR